jgi:hypothetical protein
MVPLKFGARQASSIYLYKNLRISANIHFNRQCLIKKVIPQYAKVKIAHTSPAANTTQKKAQIMRIKDEIKFLYVKTTKT